MSHKKRKFSDEEDRSLHQVFAAAAKAVSNLYANADKRVKQSGTEANRQLLERQFQWVLREYGSKEAIPVQDLLNYLQLEAQAVEAREQGGMVTVQPQVLPPQRPVMPSAFGAFANIPFCEDASGSGR